MYTNTQNKNKNRKNKGNQIIGANQFQLKNNYFINLVYRPK